VLTLNWPTLCFTFYLLQGMSPHLAHLMPQQYGTSQAMGMFNPQMAAAAAQVGGWVGESYCNGNPNPCSILQQLVYLGIAS